ncbi:VTT domain-containing protein [Zeaxanthinibacter sp. PT1]|uniref:VTT domain-containing protein n=1 Tax=Zeaxanthinibacter TaxID=561554 RepID=UPI00234BB313|nr:VTT domain-containing protein [Zeaxanthinibacter sp. PT1]MDC6350285.1 VTT domain-containing protein [Zeaxanthinibacter sp. PT1]
MDLIDLIGNTDEYLIEQVTANLVLTYLILFAIIFSESGIILCPFLPGDGLLFSIGVVATVSPLNIYIVIPLLSLAAILGYLFNYHLGRSFGRWILERDYKTIRRAYSKTEIFMKDHGQKAVIISRFFPIVRTYVPFVAGVVQMNYGVFRRQTFVGGVLWVSIFCLTGFFTGEIPWVKENYGLIFLGLVVLTMLPFLFQVLKMLRTR